MPGAPSDRTSGTIGAVDALGVLARCEVSAKSDAVVTERLVAWLPEVLGI
jgi:hypothetical protein